MSNKSEKAIKNNREIVWCGVAFKIPSNGILVLQNLMPLNTPFSGAPYW